MTRAAIDLGSNSALLLVQDDDGRDLVDVARVVGLGRGLGDHGRLRPDRIEVAVATLRDYAARAAAHGVRPEDVVAVTTSAARRAADADAFVHRVRAETGVRLRVIDGDTEARLTRRGALSDRALLPSPAARVVVVDVGGGSTEVTIGPADGPFDGGSLEVGTVRATEALLGLDRHDPAGPSALAERLDALLAGVDLRGADVAVGVAGTVTTIAAWLAGVPIEAAAAVHGARITRAELRAVVDAFLPCSPEQRRRKLAIAPDRADFVVAGATIVDRVLARAGLDALVVSARDLRHGLLATAGDTVTLSGPRE